MNLDDVRRSRAAALTVATVAEMLAVDPRTVTRACEEGQLPCLRVGRRLLIPRLPLLGLLGATDAASQSADTDRTQLPVELRSVSGL